LTFASARAGGRQFGIHVFTPLGAINYILDTAHGAIPMTVEEFHPANWFR
jgi:hypothetical protein